MATALVERLSEHWPEYAIEALLLGSFMVSACVTVAVLEHPSSPVRKRLSSSLVRRAIIGIAMGLTAIALIYSPLGQRSGAHMNPAVTLAFTALGRVHPLDAVMYIAGQFIGGVLGVGATRAVLGGVIAHASVHHVATRPGRLGVRAAFIAEFVMTFALLLIVLTLSNQAATARVTGLAAGALVAIYILVAGPISGMSMNPARSLASAIFERSYRGLWVYFVAPPLGMLSAGGAFALGVGSSGVYCAKLCHPTSGTCVFECRVDEMPDRSHANTEVLQLP